ncbi:MAG: L-ribulose-5-phosphate 4-epimerase AraD [Puniceicoccaceae bacterium]|nr:MAG: L-ribulose-5-phosphate 4-epimerase AraD [Puniceicoccaceae bacterium]
MPTYDALREECCEANRLLPGTGLVDLTFGNVSVCDRDAGAFAIKPSGVDYDRLTPADMVVLDFEGQVLAGTLRPSSDTPTHRHLLQAFTGIRAVVHTHSRHAVAFAQAGRPIPCLGTTHGDYFHGPVPVTRPLTAKETGPDYEWETGKVIVEAFHDLNPLHVPAALVRGHGPFTWGASGRQAVEHARVLEIAAQMALATLALDPAAEPLPPHLLDRHFFRKHGPGAYYGQPA